MYIISAAHGGAAHTLVNRNAYTICVLSALRRIPASTAAAIFVCYSSSPPPVPVRIDAGRSSLVTTEKADDNPPTVHVVLTRDYRRVRCSPPAGMNDYTFSIRKRLSSFSNDILIYFEKSSFVRCGANGKTHANSARNTTHDNMFFVAFNIYIF